MQHLGYTTRAVTYTKKNDPSLSEFAIIVSSFFSTECICYLHYDVMKWKLFPVTGPLCGEFTGHGEFPTQRPVTRSLMYFFMCAWINVWVNNREAGDLRRHPAHYDVIVMKYMALFFHLHTTYAFNVFLILDVYNIPCVMSYTCDSIQYDACINHLCAYFQSNRCIWYSQKSQSLNIITECLVFFIEFQLKKKSNFTRMTFQR